MEKMRDIENLFKLHYRPLCLFAIHLLKDVDSAEDVVMDCYIKLLDKWEDKDIKNPKNYLYMSVRHACYDYNLKKATHTNISLEDEAKTINANLPEDLSQTEEQAIIEANLWTALDSLPKKCREVFLMSKRDGMSYEDIAKEQTISIKTVEAQITKAYKRLREKAQQIYHFLFSFL